jgi:hypothetical protein
MSVTSVIDGICQYLGGPYDPIQRLYTTPTVPGVGVVARSWAKRDDHAKYWNGMPPGTRTGCLVVVWIPHQHEYRAAFGGEHSGLKRVVYQVELACYLRTRSAHAEDAQDDLYALRDALLAQLRADRTLGDSVFQAGEAIEGESALARYSLTYGQPSTRAELTKNFLLVQFGAVEFAFA